MLGKAYPTTDIDTVDGEVVPTASKGEYEYEEGIPDEEIEENLDILDLIDHKNIAELLGEDTLNQIAMDVIEGYDLDKSSRSSREDAMERAMNMALHITKEKNTPWPKASNVIFPIISNAAISFAARAYPALVRDDKVVEANVIGNDMGIRQEVMDPMTGMPAINPQTQEPVYNIIKEPGSKRQRADRVKEYMNYQFSEEMEEWEEDTDRMLHALPITGNMFRKVWWDSEEERIKSELVWPKHLIVSNAASGLKRAPRVSEEKEYYPHEIEENIRAGLWLDFNFGIASNEGKAADSERDDQTEKTDSQAPHFFIEQCRRMDLDNDGYPEPYIVLVHKETSEVARITANYQKDGIKYNAKGEIKRIVPEVYYIKYGFIPSPDGSFYDLGFGELLLHSSEMINSLINQLIDAGTLANTSHGFLGDGIKIKGGKVEVTKGVFTKVDTRGLSIKDNLVQIQHPEPSPTLFQLLGLLIEAAKDLGSLQEVLNGEAMGAQQAGITTLTLIEQGLTAFKSIYKRVARSVKTEVKVVYRLDSLYLHDDVYRNVMDSQIEISRADFNTKDIDIVPSSAPHMVSDMQRLARASFLDSYREDPYAKGLELRRRIFDMAGIDKPEELLQEAPPAPEDPSIALIKGQIEVEQYKAQIKAQETQHKAAMAAQEDQRKQQELILKAQVEQYKAQAQANADMIKMREHEYKMQSLAQENDIKLAENDIKAAKTQAEIQKIGMQALEIVAKIELERHKAQMEMVDRQNSDMQAQAQESGELQQIKAALADLASSKGDVKDVIRPLVDAINSLKSDASNNKFSVEISELKNMVTSMGAGQMKEVIEPIADAIRSLKENETPEKPVTKRFRAVRNKDGSLEGEIIPDETIEE